MKLSTKSGFAILAGLALSFVASGQSTGQRGYGDRSMSGTTMGAMSTADKDFIMKAYQGGMAEIELGNLAQQRGAAQDVKDYGKKLVDDHTKLNNELKDIASKEGITLPTDVSASQRRTIDRLSKLSGSQFDRAFLSDSTREHRMDIGEFQKEANSGQDPALKSFASSAVPTLQDHLSTAQTLEAKYGRRTTPRTPTPSR
jgi:putative membrane protein